MYRGEEWSRSEGEEGTTRQETVPDESLTYVSVHGFWKWCNTALFDMQIVNSDMGSYLHHMSAKAPETA